MEQFSAMERNREEQKKNRQEEQNKDKNKRTISKKRNIRQNYKPGDKDSYEGLRMGEEPMKTKMSTSRIKDQAPPKNREHKALTQIRKQLSWRNTSLTNWKQRTKRDYEGSRRSIYSQNLCHLASV